MDYTHQPCPIRIVEDCGGSFLMGTIGGGLFQGLKGFRNAPSGFVRRMYGGINAIKMRTPAVACHFAVWGTIFTTVNCGLITYRRREDPWNNIISGTATGGIMSARHGLRAMTSSAIAGFIFLGLIEGLHILTTTKFTDDDGDNEGIPIEVFSRPQRAQWEQVDSSPKSSPVEGFERVLEKKDAQAAERQGMLDLIKLAKFI